MSWKSRGVESSSSRNAVSRKHTALLCICCFCAGMVFTDRIWTLPEEKDVRLRGMSEEKLKLISDGCDHIADMKIDSKTVLGEVSRTNDAINNLGTTISNLEMELAAARAVQDSLNGGSPSSEDLKKMPESTKKRKYLMVIGINTAFSSRKRRDSVRATWMPQGEKRKKLEEEKGIIIRFVIGH
ncbi:hypothetical protein M569_10045, partial [Genlisea aurea]